MPTVAQSKLTAAERSRNASIAALERWSREDPAANAARGQAGLRARFERRGVLLLEVNRRGRVDHLERHGWITRTRVSKPGRGHKTTCQLTPGGVCDCQPTPAKGSDSRTLYNEKGSDSRTLKGPDTHLQTRRPGHVSPVGINEGMVRKGCVAPGCTLPARRSCRTCWDHAIQYEAMA